MVCHHRAKFGSHRYCIGRDIMLLFCDVIEQDHVIKGWGNYSDRNTPKDKSSTAIFSVYRHGSSGGLMALVYHVI